MTTTAHPQQTVPTWPLARRVVSGFVQPGGRVMVGRAIEGAGLDDGSRVVELAPGLGLTSSVLISQGPRIWTGVEPDPLAAKTLSKSLGGAGRDVVNAPVEATGLEDGSATVVVADSLLSTLPPEGRAAVLAESARLLRAGGRVAIIDIAPAEGDPGVATARAELAAGGLELLDVAAFRSALEAAGLVVVGSLSGAFDLHSPPALMREAGPRLALKITRTIASDAAVRGPALALREALDRNAVALRSVVVVAEMPLILGMRRPRR